MYACARAPTQKASSRQRRTRCVGASDTFSRCRSQFGVELAQHRMHTSLQPPACFQTFESAASPHDPALALPVRLVCVLQLWLRRLFLGLCPTCSESSLEFATVHGVLSCSDVVRFVGVSRDEGVYELTCCRQAVGGSDCVTLPRHPACKRTGPCPPAPCWAPTVCAADLI
jgi:hypothetical protein